MTNKEFIEKHFSEAPYKDKLLKAVKLDEEIYPSIKDSKSDFILFAFIWTKTEDGSVFWDEIHTELVKDESIYIKKVYKSYR